MTAPLTPAPGTALLPCPFCGEALTEPTAVQYPKMGLARLHPNLIDDGSCPIAGWGFYAEQLETWNTRAPALKAHADAMASALAECLERLKRCAIAGGTDEEYAECAVEGYRATLAAYQATKP